jgi:hypothetical protein
MLQIFRLARWRWALAFGSVAWAHDEMTTIIVTMKLASTVIK